MSVSKPRGSALPVLLLVTLVGLGLFGTSGCRIIWEPPEDAVERCLDPIASRDHLDKLIEDDEDLKTQVRLVTKAFSSALYKGQSNYWTVDEIEDDEAENRTYVWVTVLVPGKQNRSDSEYELVFEMERVWLDWKIHNIDGIDELAAAIGRAR